MKKLQFDPEYEKNGIRASHGMLGIGKECQKEKKKPYLYEDQEEIGYVPPACKHCSNHPSNGGTGICHCVLGNLQITC